MIAYSLMYILAKYYGKKYDYHGTVCEFIGLNNSGTKVLLQSVNDDTCYHVDIALFMNNYAPHELTDNDVSI